MAKSSPSIASIPTVHVRNINAAAWTLAKAEAALANVSLAEWLRRAIINYASLARTTPTTLVEEASAAPTPKRKRTA